MTLALFGIENDALNLTVNLLILFLVVVWLSLVAWTFFDARRRMEDQILVMCSVGASLFPFIGTIIYTILRPPEFVEDRRERELEIRAAELRVKQLTEQSCPKCEYPIEKGFLRCPNCQARVKDPCPSCDKPIDPRWAMCPYCETPTRREQPPPAKKRAPERRPRAAKRAPERSSGAQSKPPPARPSAAPEGRKPAARPAPKRTKRASEPARGKVSSGSPASSRSRPARSAKAKSGVDEATQEHRFEGESGDDLPPRPAAAS